MRIHKRIIAISVLSLSMALSTFHVASPSYASSGSDDLSLKVSRLGTTATISWTSSDPSANVRLLRDGREIRAQKGSAKFVDALDGNGPSTYVLESSRTLTPGDLGLVSDAAVRNEVQAGSKGYELVDAVGLTSVNGTAGIDAANASSAATSTLFRYQTFLPVATVTPLPVGCSLNSTTAIYPPDYFLGDNRSWNPTATSYRTRLDANINWVNGTVSGTREVGTTHVYVHNTYPATGFTLYAKTATNTSMSVTDTGTTTSASHFAIYQNVANPYCGSNGIYVNLNVTVMRSGAFALYGTRIQVPNHEVYIKDSDSVSWAVVFQGSQSSLNYLGCLTPGIGCNTSVSVSGSR